MIHSSVRRWKMFLFGWIESFMPLSFLLIYHFFAMAILLPSSFLLLIFVCSGTGGDGKIGADGMTNHNIVNGTIMQIENGKNVGNLSLNNKVIKPRSTYFENSGCLFDISPNCATIRSHPNFDISAQLLEKFKQEMKKDCPIDEQIEMIDQKLNGVGLFWMVLAIVFMSISAILFIAFCIAICLLYRGRRHQNAGFRPNVR